jgi:acetyl-CoA carboxylase beta subunit
MLDAIVDRRQMRDRIIDLLGFMMNPTTVNGNAARP